MEGPTDTASGREDCIVLQKVVIKGFRSCDDVTLDGLGHSLVLVGRNGVGKTNIFRAILWAAENALRAEPIHHKNSPRYISLEFRIGDDLYKFEISSPFKFNPHKPLKDFNNLPIESVSVFREESGWDELASRNGPNVILPDRDPLFISSSAPFLSYLLAYLAPGDPLLESLSAIREFLRHVRYYPLDEPNERDGSETMIALKDYEEFCSKLSETGSVGDYLMAHLPLRTVSAAIPLESA